MEYRNVGASGLVVSLAGLGCNNIGNRIDDAASREVVHKALDLGVTLFDTADMYGSGGASELVLGRVLGDRRKDVVLATKFGKNERHGSMGASRRYIVTALEASLKRLKTDWIDLYQIHAPDPRTPIEETLRALDDVVRAGKVRYLGCSNFPAWQVVQAQWVARHLNLNGLVSCQNEYSMLVREAEAELIPAIRASGLGLLPFFPLASGLLSGKYGGGSILPQEARLTKVEHLAARFITPLNIQRIERLLVWGSPRGRSLLELAFGWLASQPVIPSVIAGATSALQVEQNVGAVACVLSDVELAEIGQILSGASFSG